MLPYMGITKEKVAGAVLASGLVVAPLGAVGTASATCIGLSGIDIGEGCTTSLGSFALGLGEGTVATSIGFINGAIATGSDTEAYAEGGLNFAYAGGTRTYAQALGGLSAAAAGLGFAGLLGVGSDASAIAGRYAGDFLNFALNFGTAEEGTENTADASVGAVNLAANLLGRANVGTDMIVLSGGTNENDVYEPGYGTVAVNISGNRNRVTAIGLLNNATNWGNELTYPNGSDSEVTAGDLDDPTTLSWAFNIQQVFTETCSVEPCSNTVTARGPLAVAGAIGLINRTVEQLTAGIAIKTRLNPNSTAATTVLAARGAQGSSVRPSPNFTPGLAATSRVAKVRSRGGSALDSVRKQLTASVKKFSDNVNRGLSGGVKADSGKKDSND